MACLSWATGAGMLPGQGLPLTLCSEGECMYGAAGGGLLSWGGLRSLGNLVI